SSVPGCCWPPSPGTPASSCAISSCWATASSGACCPAVAADGASPLLALLGGHVALLHAGLGEDPHGDHGEGREPDHEPVEVRLARRGLPAGEQQRHDQRDDGDDG